MADAHDRLKVIVADDEGVIAETMALILNSHGFEARAVDSGEAAVDIAQEFRPDFLISDIRMGSMGGIEAAIRVQEMVPRCKVVVLSATTVDHKTQARLQSLGFEFLRKPLHPDKLIAQLRK